MDGAGFSKPWVKAGHWLANLDELSQTEAKVACNAAVIFHRQLPAEIKATLGIGSK